MATGVGRRQRADRFDNLSFSGMAVLLLASVSVGFARAEGMSGRAVDRQTFVPIDVRGKAVLVQTGWA